MSDGSASHRSARPPATPAIIRSSRDRYRCSFTRSLHRIEREARGIALDREGDQFAGPRPGPGVAVLGQATAVDVRRERELLLDLERQLGIRGHAQLDGAGVRRQVAAHRPDEPDPHAARVHGGIDVVDRRLAAIDPQVAGVDIGVEAVERCTAQRHARRRGVDRETELTQRGRPERDGPVLAVRAAGVRRPEGQARARSRSRPARGHGRRHGPATPTPAGS